MEVVSGHKGIAHFRVTVTGREAHSAQTHLGVSAVMEAVPILAALRALADTLAAQADPASAYTPKGATLTVGKIAGGTAGNILARQCEFQFDLRTVPGADPHALLAGVYALAKRIDGEIKARAPEGGVAVEVMADVPPLAPGDGGPAEAFVRRLAGDNGPARAVSYAAEAGQFQRGGFSTVLCGPGSIDQAHHADEYVDIAQLERGAVFMQRLAEALSGEAAEV
jgi:acetylornithine deacetylase